MNPDQQPQKPQKKKKQEKTSSDGALQLSQLEQLSQALALLSLAAEGASQLKEGTISLSYDIRLECGGREGNRFTGHVTLPDMICASGIYGATEEIQRHFDSMMRPLQNLFNVWHRDFEMENATVPVGRPSILEGRMRLE